MNYIKENLDKFNYCGITKWHSYGYTGGGVKLAEIEGANPDCWFFEKKLKDPFNYKVDKLNVHGQKVLDVMHQVAPDAELYMLPSGSIGIDGKGWFFEKTLPYIMDNAPFIIGASINGFNYPVATKLIKQAQDKGNIFVCAAGNDDKEGTTAFSQSEVWISVGAATLSDEGKVSYAYYTSQGKEVDCCGFSGIYVHDAKDKSRVFPQNGTSFSQPFVSGMIALVQQFFLERAGRTLFQDELMQFIQDNCIDFGEPGRDNIYGHGLFVLPNPDDIDISKYLHYSSTTDNKENITKITLQIGNKTAYVNNDLVELLVPPIIQNNTTLVPLRFIAESLGCTVLWHEDTQVIDIIKQN